jgi:hypothetical protein
MKNEQNDRSGFCCQLVLKAHEGLSQKH